ncbi:MAG: glycosyltransferase family 2 protein [Allosphingosinicella sp.]|uniref:glycosyltransferase family 2 protein n=1 Tax=Allosphingosinicella sp. TaxID=2823234 RepID=UPI003963F8B1
MNETISPEGTSVRSVSVAMATYNGARHLSEQLASLAGQTRLPDELVVTDDGSTDGTRELIETFARTAPFAVRLHPNEERLGVTRNFERALSLCTGDIVFLSDQDDVWLADKIEEVVKAFEADPGVQIVLNDKIITDGQLVSTGATMLSNIRGFGAPDSCFVAGCCAAMRADWRKLALPIPEGMSAHDSWIVGLAHRLGSAKIVEKPLQLYRRHDSNVSQNAYSSTRRVGLVDRLRQEMKDGAGSASNPEEYWEYFLTGQAAEMKRIEEAAPLIDEMGLRAQADQALEELRSVNAATSARKEIATMGRLKRIGAIARLWSQGGYRHFSGLKSAAKDLV